MRGKLMLLCCVVLTVLLCSGEPVRAEATIVSETFDTGLSKFHLDFRNHDPDNDFGWSNTSNAGGSAGEVGGTFARHEFAYVGAAIGDLTAEDTLTMRGKAYLDDTNFDGMLFIGFFTKGTDGEFVCGISIEEPRDAGWRVSLEVAGNQGVTRHILDQTEWTFDLTYSNGVLSGTIGPTDEGDDNFSLAVDFGNKVIDAFGVGTRSDSSRNDTCELYLDEVEFSAIRKASNPNPTDGTDNVCPGEVSLFWEAGAAMGGSVRHAVYFGTDYQEVADANRFTPVIFKGIARDPYYEAGNLPYLSSYYWRIDEWYGIIEKGDVWSFTIAGGRAFDPEPADGGSELNPVLSWATGCFAVAHDVYFGTNFNDVNDATDPNTAPGQGRQGAASFDPGELEGGTVYYWRIDEVNDANVWKGDIWSLTTLDPNLLILYKFDETSGDIAYDSSGHGAHGSGDDFDGDTWDTDDGRFPGCINMDSDQRITVSTSRLGTISKEVSISLWAKGAYRDDADNWIFSTGYETGGETIHLSVALPNGSRDAVIFQAGNDANDRLEWTRAEGADPSGWRSGWHHFVFIKNENTQVMQLYFDGSLVDTLTGVNTTMLAAIVASAADVRIGARFNHNDDFVGKIDDFRIYDYALSEAEVTGLFRGGDVAVAWGPKPHDGAGDVSVDAMFSWRPGDFAVSHDVYFGTSFEDVRDATTSATLDVYEGNQGPNEFTPTSTLEFETTYYWRIDEVNVGDGNSPWKGNVWSFNAANFLIIDDMESYNDSSNPIYDTWEDGVTSLNSSSNIWVATEPNIHGGKQSMEFLYENQKDWWSGHYWSEVVREYTSAQDWDSPGTKMLTLYFYGLTDNAVGATENMWIALEDSSTNIKDVDYDGDANDIAEAEWHEWNVALSEFTDVNTSAVKKILIGFGDMVTQPVPGGTGTVWFDDIRLYPPKCVPQFGPVGDLSGNCVVDMPDVEIMADEWLESDTTFEAYSSPNSAGVIGWWKLDDGDGNTTVDSSSNGNNGAIEGDYSWVGGRIGAYALDLGGGRVLVPDAPELRPTGSVSACAWISYPYTQDHSARVVVKGADNAETFGLEIDGDDHFVFLVRDVNGVRYHVTSGELDHDEWIHIAGTYDGNEVKCYVNGALADSRDDANSILSLSQDTNDLAIGNRSDTTDREFVGTVDEVLVYDYALSGAEVAHLATGGTGIFLMDSVANLHDSESPGSRAVNLRDYALLMENWLKEKLWPQ